MPNDGKDIDENDIPNRIMYKGMHKVLKNRDKSSGISFKLSQSVLDLRGIH